METDSPTPAPDDVQFLESLVADVARLEHGENFDRLVRDPSSERAWLVTLKDGGTDTIRIGCIRP